MVSADVTEDLEIILDLGWAPKSNDWCTFKRSRTQTDTEKEAEIGVELPKAGSPEAERGKEGCFPQSLGVCTVHLSSGSQTSSDL